MLKILKYPLRLEDVQTLELPAFFKPLTVQIQVDRLCLWALVDTDRRTAPVAVYIYGTGFDMPQQFGEYIATVQQGPYVWHVFIQR